MTRPRTKVTAPRVALVVAALLLIAPAVWYAAADREGAKLDDPGRKEFAPSHVRLGDGVTAYELTGGDERGTVVLIHGATIPSFAWDYQIEPLTSAGLRVVRYDQFGRGGSDRPRAKYDRVFFRKQLEELLDALGLEEEVTLVGHSLGGAIAAEYTVANPGKVDRLVLVDPVVDGVADMTPFDVARTPVVGAFAMRTMILPALVGRADEHFATVSDDPSRWSRLYRRQMEYEGFEDAMLAMFRSDVVGDHRPAYGKLAGTGVPVLMVWGDRDEDIRRADVDFVKAALPELDLRILEGVGHSPTMEAPERLNEILVDFIVTTK